ncbi:hypothetical protein SAMN05443252_1178 [Bacillus sp. OV322]|nr:hypothetical protein [Bacillus sp. OV322]SFD03482.1 hypothetical protein SAMN05443252_1178 [Bacillus sp. OV322]
MEYQDKKRKIKISAKFILAIGTTIPTVVTAGIAFIHFIMTGSI